MTSTFNARDAAVYERSMGRWSRRLAPGFLAFADISDAACVLDAGCGPGSLLFTLAQTPAHTRITGIDASEIYVAAAQAANTDPRIEIHHGDACALPFADSRFDAALSQLVLQFVPEPAAMAAELVRVVRPGGVVAAAVWNSAGGMPHQRMFWDIAAMLDPAAAKLRAQTFSRPMTRRGDLAALFAAAGLEQVRESFASVWMDFADFADFWDPIAGGEGTLGKYVLGLSPERTALLETHLREAYESGAQEGRHSFACTALVCRGLVGPKV
jgi:SAM-dependent methyltransferase